MRYQRGLTVGLALGVALWAATCKSNEGPPPPPPAPTVDAGADVRASVGQAVPLTARVAPPGANPSSYRWTLAWGDASVDSGDVGSAGLITASHTYAAAGHYAVSLTGRASSGTTDNDTTTVFVDAPGTPQVLLGAGDIGECGIPWAPKTAALIDTIPGTVFTLGDNAYPYGRDIDYANCYAPSWGKFKKRTHPVPGNHDYQENLPSTDPDTTARGYFGYFGVAAGNGPVGNYSYDVGAWHIVVLNSSFEEKQILGRVLDTTAQLSWLDADLAAHPTPCALAMWHHPRFSSGVVHGSDTRMTSFWQHLYNAGVDVVLSGHEHNYERFAPQTPDGTADPARGIREFVVGTGGGGYDSLDVTKVTHAGNSEVGSVDHGVIKFTLMSGSYHWEFIPVGYTLPVDQTPPEYSHTDSGTASCH